MPLPTLVLGRGGSNMVEKRASVEIGAGDGGLPAKKWKHALTAKPSQEQSLTCPAMLVMFTGWYPQNETAASNPQQHRSGRQTK